MFEKITHQSWFSRMGGAIKGVVFGGLMFLIAFPVLFLNEGRAVRTAKGLTEGAGSVVKIDANQVDQSNEGNFVHLSGQTEVGGSLADEIFDVDYDGVRLERHVEMYQWVETTTTKKKKKLGGGRKTITVFDYEKEWSSGQVDSTEFEQSQGHENPTQMPYGKFETQASDVTLGAFKLPESLVNKIQNSETINFELEELPGAIASGGAMRGDAPDGGSRLYLTSRKPALATGAAPVDVLTPQQIEVVD